MNLGTYDITIDFSKLFVHNNTSIYFKEGDLNTAKVRAKLTMQRKVIDITGCKIVVKIETMTGEKINDTATIIDATNGIIEIDFKSNALIEGTNFFELKIVKGESVKESSKLAYRVLDSIEDAGSIEATNEYPILIQLINDTTKALQDAKEALNKANEMQADINEAIDNTNIAISNAETATSNANSKIEEIETAKSEIIKSVDSSIATMKSDVEIAKTEMASKADEKIADIDRALASGTNDLEVKEARKDANGVVHDTLKQRLEADLAKGKIHYETVEGSYISVNNTLDSYVQNIEIKGNTIQNESDLADIKSVGDKVEEQELYRIPILCTGKNIANPMNILQGLYVDGATSSIMNTSSARSIVVKIIRNTDYVISFDKDVNRNVAGLSNTLPKLGDKVKVIYPMATTPNRIFKFNSGEYNFITFYFNNGDIDVKIQIEEGTQSTPYEPYQEHKLTILSPTQLEKVGDLEDRIIEKDGVWGVEKRTYDWTLDSNTTVRRGGETPGNLYVFNIYKNCNDSTVAICNYLPFIKNWTSSTPCFYTQTADIVFMIDEDITLDEFKSRYVGKLTFKLIAENSQFIPLPHAQQVKLKTFANKTNISFLTEIEGTIKADVSKSLGATVNSNTQEISDLWDFVLKNNLANFAVALNTLDTKLKLEQLTKTPR